MIRRRRKILAGVHAEQLLAVAPGGVLKFLTVHMNAPFGICIIMQSMQHMLETCARRPHLIFPGETAIINAEIDWEEDAL